MANLGPLIGAFRGAGRAGGASISSVVGGSLRRGIIGVGGYAAGGALVGGTISSARGGGFGTGARQGALAGAGLGLMGGASGINRMLGGSYLGYIGAGGTQFRKFSRFVGRAGRGAGRWQDYERKAYRMVSGFSTRTLGY